MHKPFCPQSKPYIGWLSLFTQPPKTLLNTMAKVIWQLLEYFLIWILPESKNYSTFIIFGWFWLILAYHFNISLSGLDEGLRLVAAQFCDSGACLFCSFKIEYWILIRYENLKKWLLNHISPARLKCYKQPNKDLKVLPYKKYQKKLIYIGVSEPF